METNKPTQRYFFASFLIKYATGLLGFSSCGYVSKGDLYPEHDSLIKRLLPVQHEIHNKPLYQISLLSISEFKNEFDYLTFLGKGIRSINLN